MIPFFVFFYPQTGRIGLPVTPRLFMLNMMEDVADWYAGLTVKSKPPIGDFKTSDQVPRLKAGR